MTVEEKKRRGHELAEQIIRNIRKRSKRSDEEFDKAMYNVQYLSEERANEKIKELMKGPKFCWMEGDDGVPSLISREELIVGIKARIR